MASSSPSSSSSSGSQKPSTQPKVRQPAFANWPTVKILVPPQGRFSPKTDEWCITYCTQSIRGRLETKQPSCRSLCVRHIFAHEVRNILAFRHHQAVDEEGQARYPLPAEGQTVNIPKLLGGKPPEPDKEPGPIPPKRFWEEGWYFWTSTTPQAALEHMATMHFDLRKQQQREAYKDKRKATWIEYQQFIERKQDANPEAAAKFHGKIVPPKPLPDTTQDSLLIALPPQIELWHSLDRVLKPTWNSLNTLQESIASGNMRRFATRCWENAFTKEPWKLANHALETAGNAFFGKNNEDSDKEQD
ncbi:hypothetical protein CYLTODRAFT_351948 [Cylindrobasidium torrendii FP15055 ss-10]|uniref:Uncharacterized protein n=1 Tax=Cylindrobasidium torrendii FP15055 ss-10 TaxID=1314674 RepID=A0A0D7BEN8_9AGAR|nr:hypothetical protein CYLTODRAFT_351948 [Cylindrobasidium torrendii FP15055 ss-10]